MVVEALVVAVWLAQLLPALSMQDGSTLVAMAARVVVGVLLFTTGRALRERRFDARRPAALVLLASAALRAFDITAQLTPSDLSPTWREPVAIGYAVYAIAAAGYLWFLRPGRDST